MPAEQQKDLSIIIVAHDVRNLVEECLTRVKVSEDYLKKEIIYVDNGSGDGTVEMVKKKFDDVLLIESPDNLGFIKANNLGYQAASGKYILMLNSDAFVGKDTLRNLTDFMDRTPDCGVVGCKAVDAKGLPLPSARNFPTPWRIFLMKLGLEIPCSKGINDIPEFHDSVMECDWVTGCCLLVRKEIIDAFDFFLRPEFFMYNDDNDLCLRVKKSGWKIYCHPETITHLAGVNNNKISVQEKDRKRLERLTLESDYLYFRHNYNLLYVLSHFLLTIAFETYQLLKSCLLLRGREKLKCSLESMQLALALLLKTKFGKNPISTQSSSRKTSPVE